MREKFFLAIIIFISSLAAGGCAPKQSITITYPDGTKETSVEKIKSDKRDFRLEIRTNQEYSLVTVWRWKKNGYKKREYRGTISCQLKTPGCIFNIKSKHLSLKVKYEQGEMQDLPRFQIKDKGHQVYIYAWGYTPDTRSKEKFSHCLFKLP